MRRYADEFQPPDISAVRFVGVWEDTVGGVTEIVPSNAHQLV